MTGDGGEAGERDLPLSHSPFISSLIHYPRSHSKSVLKDLEGDGKDKEKRICKDGQWRRQEIKNKAARERKAAGQLISDIASSLSTLCPFALTLSLTFPTIPLASIASQKKSEGLEGRGVRQRVWEGMSSPCFPSYAFHHFPTLL